MGSFVVVLVCILFLGCEGRPDGAPRSACQTLTPQHSGIQPQQSSPPYSVSVTKVGNKLRVKVFSSIGEELEGFILQARYARDGQRMVDGHFTTRDGVSRTIDCFNGKQNTLTQYNPTPKREIVTEWTPTTTLDEDIIFRATVAKTFAIFWTKVDSSPIRIKSDAAAPSNGARSERKEAGGNSVYENCFVSKGCFGIPSGCINRQDCQVLLSYTKAIEGIAFRMNGFLEDDSYMAMGLSNDALMGDDFVTECVMKDSSIVVRHSWNEGKTNGRTRELPSDLYESGFNDGFSGCAFTLPYVSQHNGREFNLANATYYTLLAKGPMRNERLSYHQLRAATQQGVNFSAFEAIESEGITDSVKIHGCFMVTAWVGLVSLGILLARHFKSAWENKTICGVKIWFAFHRGLMVAALVLVVIAFIVIFIEKNGWNYQTSNPHAVLGCIATALGLCQPIMALFRPAADHPKRMIFNWLHFTVGNAAQLIAVITIFFAVTLEPRLDDKSFYWVMSVFVIVYLIFHFFFQVHTYWTSEQRKKNEIKMLDLAGRGGNAAQNGAPEKNLVNHALRIIFLGIFTIFLAAILLAMYIIIGIA